ncbi:TetR/AcrR family transcriptional regulator [Microbacterium thalassium]|uniref:AcrR family transcriptional regulator n=1 Tax=Microbacterium thalassium TaxID=362649 RepID=A0A7X0FT84_9MICO|nr:TetR/AcrR family transcriptional regulator [Microbacterium thalassium]MBB6392737.1 AcrR family transcriptional regulator [Microbacterium thalassium]GLK23031.1 TetR family transcriptional regulator [Microbacterium thalassium]
MTPGTDHRSRPRRRGAALEDAIIAAAIDELAEVGYSAMTMDAVARRAGAGKFSLYRRWPGKAELVREAAYRLVGDPVLPPEPSTLREDLLAAFRFMAEQMQGPAGEALRGIVSESLQDAEAPTVADSSRGSSQRVLREILSRAVARGEPVDPEVSPIRMQAPVALIQHRFLAGGGAIDDEFLVSVVDEVAVPLLTR